VFRAECADGEVVVVDEARYGRMSLGRCVELDLGYIGCQRDVVDIVDRRCSGLRVCEMRIPDAELESTRACLKELKTYLQVSYHCVTREYVCAEYILFKQYAVAGKRGTVRAPRAEAASRPSAPQQ